MPWTNPDLSRQLSELADGNQPVYVRVHLGDDLTFTGDWTEAEKDAVRDHLVVEPVEWLSPVDGTWFTV